MTTRFHYAALATFTMLLSGFMTAHTEETSLSLDAVHAIARHLPDGFVRDASVSYQSLLQRAIDESAPGDTLRFPPGDYLLDDATGLRIPENRTLDLAGVMFLLSPTLAQDGQALLLDSVQKVTINGGRIQGQRESWPGSVNVAGIRITGASSHLRIRDTEFLDLSSNGIGVFGTAEQPIHHIWIQDIYARNCCNIYHDYLSEKGGPEPGSIREDQGSICFYYVENFVVQGNYLDGSRSDGTHFKSSRHGQISDNQILNSQMGGFFLEDCHNVVARGNIMRNNGSRGCTVERNSTSILLQGNVVERSGREGLWAPDVAEVLVVDNIFRENGQKDDGDKDSEIRINDIKNYAVQPNTIRIEGNIFTSTAHSNGVIQINAGVGNGIVIRNNSFSGPVTHLLLDADVSVDVEDNTGLSPAP